MHKNGNNANIGIRGFIIWKQKKSSNKMLHYPFWTNLASACKTETLSSLCSHALMMLTKTET